MDASPKPATTACSHRIPHRPSVFLVLAPVHSDGYPSGPMSPRSPPAADSPASPMGIAVADKARRSSSVSSASSAASGPARFLKLGPVHFGGEPGVPDFSE
ncbi:hypothetical protein BDY21DRAFT_367025 [Lineolata rhizophorae]|uniref:Uncharacterized protein n=1 Tax=Lineolata rhizophorae TaxID=578093 RepID=A0A6A6NQ20_9PEZI|nr:hypothetical protein BDY21DRAFT_367025 [Lineolata rhizophorae]